MRRNGKICLLGRATVKSDCCLLGRASVCEICLLGRTTVKSDYCFRVLAVVFVVETPRYENDSNGHPRILRQYTEDLPCIGTDACVEADEADYDHTQSSEPSHRRQQTLPD